jgi:hypothetical protein
MTNEERILRDYFESDAQKRSVEREFAEIAREWPVGLTPAEMEQLLMRDCK